MPTTSVPTYDSIIEACKTGCFCCGARLDPDSVKPKKGVAKKNGAYVVMCSSCGDPTIFAIRPSRQKSDT